MRFVCSRPFLRPRVRGGRALGGQRPQVSRGHFAWATRRHRAHGPNASRRRASHVARGEFGANRNVRGARLGAWRFIRIHLAPILLIRIRGLIICVSSGRRGRIRNERLDDDSRRASLFKGKSAPDKGERRGHFSAHVSPARPRLGVQPSRRPGVTLGLVLVRPYGACSNSNSAASTGAARNWDLGAWLLVPRKAS